MKRKRVRIHFTGGSQLEMSLSDWKIMLRNLKEGATAIQCFFDDPDDPNTFAQAINLQNITFVEVIKE